jgi:hypothetical protein
MRKLSVVVCVIVIALLAGGADAELKSKRSNAMTKGKPVAQTCELSADQTQCEVPLIAGQFTEVGKVYVDIDATGDEAAVTFEITDPAWIITESHLYLGSTPPAKSAPGSFPFQHSGLETQVDVYFGYEVATALDDDGCLYVAVHAVVEKTCDDFAYLHEFAQSLPDSVEMSVASGEGVYFSTTISAGGTPSLSGTLTGWCIDSEHTIYTGTEYLAQVYSSYEDLLAAHPNFDQVDKPENLPLVNYIINAYEVPTYSDCDIQWAIWKVIDDDPRSPCGGNDETVAQMIADDAIENGQGFVPGCDDKVAVILVPTGTAAQVTIAQVTIAESNALSCNPDVICEESEETAWGLADWADGNDDDANSCEFPKGTGWGTYFKCCSGESDECDPEEVLSSDAFYQLLVDEGYDECVIDHYFPNN